MKINSNIPSLIAQRNLGQSTSQLQRSFERLSSGLRINRAGDDAAGLSIAAALNADARVFNQAMRNINDGLSMLSIADATVENLGDIVIRQKELLEQSANGVLSNRQRDALQDESDALVDEYNRLLASTKFNDVTLYPGAPLEVKIQAGYGVTGQLSFTLGAGLGAPTGDGTFTLGSSFAQSPGDIVSGDVNGDGLLDAVVLSAGTNVQVFLGNGNGTFKDSRQYAFSGTGANVAQHELSLGDFNGDGILDIAAEGNYSNSIDVLLGNGNGTFKAFTSYATAGGSKGNAIGDVNGDGVLDLVTADYGPDTYSVLLGNNNGTFRAATSFHTNSSDDSDAELVDINGDSKLDLVLGKGVYLGNGDGTFSVSQLLGTSLGTNHAAVDVNRDGRPDLVGVGSSNLNVMLSNGNGTFRAPTAYGTGSITGYEFDVLASDVNGDNYVDLVWNTVGAFNVFLGNGDGSFKAQTSYAVPGDAYGLALADFDGDLVKDVLTSANGLWFAHGNARRSANMVRLELSTQAQARSSMDLVDEYLDGVHAERTLIGAAESRMGVALNNLSQSRINFMSAASQIEDVDVAEETSRLVRSSILQQAGAAVLAQTNIQPQLALTLLANLRR